MASVGLKLETHNVVRVYARVQHRGSRVLPLTVSFSSL
jgi:hypothetical protein